MSDERLVYENMRTPWGAAQTVKILIDGIGQVHTAGHGGFKLSHERNLKVPTYRRAFAEGRLKKRKMPAQGKVKVWIEPAVPA